MDINGDFQNTMTIEEKYALYQRISEYLERPEIQKKIADIFIEELLYGVPDIKDIELGEKYETNL